MSAEVEPALDHVARRARAAGKLAGVFAHSGERAGELARQGLRSHRGRERHAAAAGRGPRRRLGGAARG